MSVITAAALVYIVATTPVVHFRFLDKFSDVQTCSQVIEAVKRQEATEPEDERISPRLRCVLVSFAADQDGDGPSKPVAVPEKPVSEHTPYPCRNAVTRKPVACKEASYTE